MPTRIRSEANNITHEALLLRLSYDPETGVFVWISGKRKGRKAGSFGKLGYRYIQIGKYNYMEHRLAWFYVNGRWPKEEIDHIDRSHGNNRISNLREANRFQQHGNRTMNRNNSTGFRGIYPCCGKWKVLIWGDGESKYLGLHETIEAALAVFNAAALEKWGPQFYTPQLPPKP